MTAMVASLVDLIQAFVDLLHFVQSFIVCNLQQLSEEAPAGDAGTGSMEAPVYSAM